MFEKILLGVGCAAAGFIVGGFSHFNMQYEEGKRVKNRLVDGSLKLEDVTRTQIQCLLCYISDKQWDASKERVYTEKRYSNGRPELESVERDLKAYSKLISGKEDK